MNPSTPTKSKLKVALEKFLAAFSAETPAAEPQAVELKEITTADGSVLVLDNLEVGAAVTLIGTDGEAPAPDGNYDFDDNGVAKTLVIEAGVVKDIIEAAAPEAAPVSMSAAEITAEIEKQVAAMAAKFEAKLAAIESANNVVVEENKTLRTAFSTLIQEIGEIEQQEAPNTPDVPSFLERVKNINK